jgi:hypothetical protein
MSKFSTAVGTVCSFAVAAAIIAACPARGQENIQEGIKQGAQEGVVESACGGVPDLTTNPTLSLGHVASTAARIHFVKDAIGQRGCPSTAPDCSERAYLVPGDHVIVIKRQGAFVCSTYINVKGDDWTGFLPAGAVAADTAPPVAVKDWLGKWSRLESDIAVETGNAGYEALRITGRATWGSGDSARVKRGAVNTGAFEADVKPAGDRLSFAVGDGATVPVDKADDLSCKVWMRLIGPWLVVDDNNGCGGHNVSFRGFYSHRP